jgi:polyhydroxyalkanoate synthesis regulator phasin
MKSSIVAVIAVLVVAVIIIVGLPVLMDKHIAGLKHDVQDMKQRLQKIEDESKVAPLEPTADTQKIIRTINALALQVGSNENAIRKDIALQNETIQKQKAATDEAFKKQMEAIEKNHADMQSRLHITRFNAAVEDIRQHVLKARMEIIAKNLGNAKTEVDFIDDLFATIYPSAKEEQKTLIDEMRASLKKAKVEIDTDLPSFINRMNSIWHETGKLLR